MIDDVIATEPPEATVSQRVPLWFWYAMRELGQAEVRGGENPRIIAYHASTTLKAREDEVPWCSSFANWCFQQAGLPGTFSAAARSWLTWGQPAGYWLGAVAVFWRGSPTSASGHVAFLVRDAGDYVHVLGGNQSDSVKVSAYPKSQLLALRWPVG